MTERISWPVIQERTTTRSSQSWMDRPTYVKPYREDKGELSALPEHCLVSISDALLHIVTKAPQRRLRSKMRAKFALFGPSVKLRKGLAKCLRPF